MRYLELARYAIENAWRSRLRTLLTIAGIAIASGALVSMVGFILGLREQVEIPIRQFGLLNNIEVNQNAKSPPLDDDLIKEIEAIDGVEYAQPELRISEAAITRAEHADYHKCSVFGVPREAGLIGFSRELITAGSFFSLEDSNEVILGADLVPQLGFTSAEAAIGQPLVLQAGGLVAQADASFEREEKQIPLVVAGVYTPPRFATSFSQDSILLPMEIMRSMPTSWMELGLRQLRSRGERMKGFGRVIVRAKSPRDVMRIEKKLRAMKFNTLSVIDRMKEMKKFFVFMEILLSAVGTVALIVAGLGILNTLTMTVMERYQEIGIYKSIGASHGDIRLLFLVEAAAVGFLGGVAGLLLARVVSWILRWAFNTYASGQGVDGPDAVFVFPVWLLAGAVIYSVVVSVISGIYPASKAANIDPIRALRRG